jgi:uncharacterized protein (TIGR03437 family)
MAYNISTVAGNGTAGYSGDAGPAIQAELSNPCGIALDSGGNIYIADEINNRIREAAPGGNINTVAGDGTEGFTGDGGAATSAEINLPCGIVVGATGNIYFTQTDTGGTTTSAVREFTVGGNISTIAGGNSTTPLGPGYSGDGGPAVNAQVSSPLALALDSAGDIYIADTGNSVIREITTNGNIKTVATYGVSLSRPEGIALDAAGNLYIADTHNQCVRRVASGTATTIAGSCGNAGYSGDDGAATQALLDYPTGVAVDSVGNIYVVDSHNFRVRVIEADNGKIYTIAGNGTPGLSGDGGAAVNAQLNFPFSLALGAKGVIYICDQQNNEIRMLTPALGTPTIALTQSAGAFGAFASTAAPGSWVEIYGSNLAVDTRNWATSDFTGTTAPTNLDGTIVSIGDQNAVVSYISPGQVNAQIPLTLQPGTHALTVVNSGGTSAAYTMTINATEPGLDQAFTVSSEPYVTAVVNGTDTFILPASANLAGVTSRPALPGDVLNLFGIGFGPVSPEPAQGQLVEQGNSLNGQLTIQIGGVDAMVEYAGFAPGYIGLYQFNVEVPNVPAGNLVPVKFILNGVAGTQTLYTSVASSQ